MDLIINIHDRAVFSCRFIVSLIIKPVAGLSSSLDTAQCDELSVTIFQIVLALGTLSLNLTIRAPEKTGAIV